MVCSEIQIQRKVKREAKAEEEVRMVESENTGTTENRMNRIPTNVPISTLLGNWNEMQTVLPTVQQSRFGLE